MASSASLTKLFAQKMKTSNQQSITGIDLHTKGDHVVIRGTVHKRIGIPFEIEGRVDNVEGRAIRLHAEKIKAVGLPVKGLLNMLGVELGSLINPDSTAGVTVQENSILFDPEQLANIRGHFTKLQVVGNGLVVDFGPAATQPEAKLNRTRQ